MPTVLSKLKSTFQPIVQFIYPPTCFVCEARLGENNSRVCEACWSSIRTVAPEDQLFKEMHARITQGSSSHLSELLSLFHFEKGGTLQSIIHQLKYDGMTVLGVELGRMLGEKVTAKFSTNSIHGIVPVPLHPTKLRERGYNQSEHIARGIREVTGLPIYKSFLKRHKYTATQTQLDAAERKENVGDAFVVNKGYLISIEGKTLLLVDDVITTGATIEACAEVLMKNGSAKAIAGSAALADHRLSLP